MYFINNILIKFLYLFVKYFNAKAFKNNLFYQKINIKLKKGVSPKIIFNKYYIIFRN